MQDKTGWQCFFLQRLLTVSLHTISKTDIILSVQKRYCALGLGLKLTLGLGLGWELGLGLEETSFRPSVLSSKCSRSLTYSYTFGVLYLNISSVQYIGWG